eukprot:gene2805-3417_t
MGHTWASALPRCHPVFLVLRTLQQAQQGLAPGPTDCLWQKFALADMIACGLMQAPSRLGIPTIVPPAPGQHCARPLRVPLSNQMLWWSRCPRDPAAQFQRIAELAPPGWLHYHNITTPRFLPAVPKVFSVSFDSSEEIGRWNRKWDKLAWMPAQPPNFVLTLPEGGMMHSGWAVGCAAGGPFAVWSAGCGAVDVHGKQVMGAKGLNVPKENVKHFDGKVLSLETRQSPTGYWHWIIEKPVSLTFTADLILVPSPAQCGASMVANVALLTAVMFASLGLGSTFSPWADGIVSPVYYMPHVAPSFQPPAKPPSTLWHYTDPVLILWAGRNDRREPKNTLDLVEDLQQFIKTIPNVHLVYTHLDGASLEGQIRLFNNASMLIGPHGSNLANMVFMKTGTRVLEFVRKWDANRCYYDLSQAAGLDYGM